MAGSERLNMAGEGGTSTEAPRIAIANASGVVIAERPVSAERLRPKSVFEQTLDRVAAAEASGNNVELQAAIRDRDELLRLANGLALPNGETVSLFHNIRAELSGVYYHSRVGVTNAEKEGKGEYQGRGTLQTLKVSRREADTNPYETRSNFWSSQFVKDIEYQLGGNVKLEDVYGRAIDYFNQKSLDLIYEVVRDRKRHTFEDPKGKYPDPAFLNLWNGPVLDVVEHQLRDENGNLVDAQNFDDYRSAIEEARRREPWVPNRLNYESYIRFVADDVEELGEMIPYIVARVERKLGTGQPDKLSQRLEQQKELIDNALADFTVESESEFRRLKSTLADNLNLMGAYYFSEKVRDDWGPYLSYMGLLADATQDTEQQDHLIDALILDRDGLTLLASNEFLKDDGIFWRYNEKSAGIALKPHDVSKLFIWQKNRRQEISKFLMSKRLREMQDLLDNHPAFQRLKQEFEALDDAEGQQTGETRWEEYTRKALDWGKTDKYGDSRNPERVIFQHPLARSFSPPTKNAAGGVESEFLNMFEEDGRVTTDRWYEATKRRKVRSIMEKTERLCRILMLDSAAALAWHVVHVKDKDNLTQQETENLDEINRYLKDAGENEINFNEAVPQKTLYRALMQACIREDKQKQPKDRAFKMYDLLTERLGLDLDVPLFAGWYLGWHDTGRPAVILRAIKKDDRPGSLNDAMSASGMDEKNTGTSWIEKERRLGILMQLVMYAKFGRVAGRNRYSNFPGHDTPGAGVKDIRNYLNLMYGTSRGTVWLDDLLKEVGFPIKQEFPKDFGATRDQLVQLVALCKWGNEVVFAQSGYAGAIEGPRDMKSWVKGTDENVTQSKTLTTGNKEGFALMKDGPLSGGYLWRDYNLNIDGKYMNQHINDRFFAIRDPEGAIEDMKESTYRAGIDLAAKVIKPTIDAMNHVVDSTSGPNPGTAKFVRTLMLHGIFKWMDTSSEFRQKPGYAVDANLHTARYFMHQYLLEYGDNGLIYDDKEWDQIMLGYIRNPDGSAGDVRYEVRVEGDKQMVKDKNGKWIVEKIKDKNGKWIVQQFTDQNGELIDVIQEGLIDAFPKDLRDEILQINIPENKKRYIEVKGTHQYKGQTIKFPDYILPFGLRSKFPETMANFYRDKESVQKDYKGALASQVKPRRQVTRP